MRRLLLLLLLALSLVANGALSAPAKVIRVGYFPNITHAQALVGMATEAFAKELGPGVEIKTFLFNAGPTAMEALMAGQLDLTYVGPNPAITCYMRTNGEILRIIAGAASGGAGLVVREDAGIRKPSEFAGKRIATPQLGNTQDVSCRHYVQVNGLKTTEFGGNVRILPTANPDQLTLFMKKEIDGAWTVEPWVSRLIKEAGGRLFLDERSLWPKGLFVTGHLAARTEFLKDQPQLVKAWLRAHVAVTRKINADPEWARKILNGEIRRYTGKALDEDVLEAAWKRLNITYDPICSSLHVSAEWAYDLGFLGRTRPDLDGIYDLGLLNEVLKAKGLEAVEP